MTTNDRCYTSWRPADASYRAEPQTAPTAGADTGTSNGAPGPPTQAIEVSPQTDRLSATFGPRFGYSPTVPSIASRRKSAWPAWRAVSSTRCSSTHRSEKCRPSRSALTDI